ncbi:uncharacterized protein BX664DRAFT_342143 [Halteromyces radiatus]|uniref:uncharacterized protein n=1 Tax=Halteromyces radiatus TaxID=101107 RepID=UPI00221FF930|nr:uncharacterized protein BX664DRAFT_342143 [Halteromyces radiatus]KAI8080036.1 hypothetical protein BX664DRAFT_342143 [Halteromyces radiatus]
MFFGINLLTASLEMIFNKMAGSTTQFVLDDYTFLDPENFNFCTSVGNEVTDERPLFGEENSCPNTNNDDTSSGSTLNEMQETNDLNVDKHPFFIPTSPFVCTTEDMIQLLQLIMPSYLYKLSIIKDKQQSLLKEEQENLVPLVIHLLHDHSEKPTDQHTLQQYLKERSRYLHQLLGDLMPATTKHAFIKKIKRKDTWVKN